VLTLAKHLSGESSLPTPPDGDHLAFVLGVSKKEMLINQDLLAANRFLCCRGLPVIGQEDKVDSYRRAVINGSVFSCARMPASKLNNSYTVQYKDASERTQFGEIQRFFVLRSHHVALVTKLIRSGSLTSGITPSSDILNDICNSGDLVHHMAVTKRSTSLFCIPLCHIQRKCVVVSTSGDNILTISTFPNMVEHD